MESWVSKPPGAVFVINRRVRLVDGTRVKEPGPTGSSWCVHYSIELPSLRCCELLVQDKHGLGESFKRFSISPGDLMVGDRAYGYPTSISYVAANRGDVLVRFPWNVLPLWSDENTSFDLLGHLRSLSGTEVGD